MIKVTPKVKNILVPAISIIAGFLVGALIMLAWRHNSTETCRSMF